MSSINYNFLLIGNSNSGKKDFFSKFTTDKFDEKNKFSIGIEKKTFEFDLHFSIKEGKKEKTKFSITLFDTAGQEKFRAFTFSYLRGSDAFLFIYDITDKSSFESVQSWSESIRETLGLKKGDLNYTLILIGNKLDLVEEDIKEREVAEDEAKQMCKEYEMIWGGEHSIKNLNFEEFIKLFEIFALELYKRIGDNSYQKQMIKKKELGLKRKIKKVGEITSEEQSINKISEEKKSRIKKNSFPSDDSDK